MRYALRRTLALRESNMGLVSIPACGVCQPRLRGGVRGQRARGIGLGLKGMAFCLGKS